jgi:hypothetical protein
MILLLRMLAAVAPAGFTKREIQNLFRSTASAFGCAAPGVAGLPFDQCLSEYARFTRSQAVRLCAPGGDRAGASERLFRVGRGLGERIRKLCLIATMEEAVSAMEILYSIIGIQARSGDGRAMTVSRCSFSAVYTPETCSVISALDDGIFAGLSGGGRLTFKQRITDGSVSCLAEIIPVGGLR